MANTVDQKMLRQTKFPAEFNQKVDMQKVNIEVMKKWIAGKISEILGNEDDVVIELCFNLLEGSRYPNIKVLQIQLTGFLEKDTAAFCKELWTLCLSAQSNPQGVPKELLEAKKLELIQEKIATEKAAEIARRRQEQERARDRDMDRLRRRNRSGRGDRGRFRDQEPVTTSGHRRFEQRSQENSRSPPPRSRNSRDYHFPPSRREVDTYIPPSNSRGQERRMRRSRSQSSSPSRSTSRSPPRRKRRRSRPRSLSGSATPQRHKERLSRDASEQRVNDSQPSGNKRGLRRGDNRIGPASNEGSRSRSPRSTQRGRRRATGSSQSPSPSGPSRLELGDQHTTARRKSRSLPSRSPTRRLYRSDTPEEKAARQDAFRDADADVSKVKRRRGDRYYESSQSSSQSPERHAKQLRHVRRDDSTAKRRRNSSSIEPEKSSYGKAAATAAREGGK